MIVPQRVVAPRSRSGRGIDADIVATRALYHFLTPVAEHIALETRSSLGSVVRKGTHKSFQSTLSWLGYLCIIEALLLQVAIPVDTEVHAQTIRISCYMVIGNGRYRRIMRTVTYCTRNVIIKITSQTATIIIGICLAIIYLARSCIAIVVGRSILITSKHLLTMDIRIKITYMLSIAMTETSSRKSLAIIVDNHRTEYDFITSVPIHIGYDIVVITLSIPRRTHLVVGPLPANRQIVGIRIHIVCDELMTGIDTTRQEDTWMLAIEIRSTEEEFVGTVAVAITPSSLQISLACFQTLQRIIYALVWLTRSTLAIPEELLAIMGKPFYASFSLWLAIVLPGSSILAVSTNGIGSAISHVDSRAFFKSHYDFCLAIHIPVVTYDILLVVLEVAHVRTTVHPPENLTILLQTGQHRIFLGLHTIDGRSILRIKLFTFLLVGELHQNLQLAIAIHIGAAGIVRDIS